MQKEKEECLNEEEEEEEDKKVRLEGQNPEQNIFTNTHTRKMKIKKSDLFSRI